MSDDDLVDKIRKEDYLISIFQLGGESIYVEYTTKIVKFVQDIFRYIEPSHFEGELIVFMTKSDEPYFDLNESKKYLSPSELDTSNNNITIQMFKDENKIPQLRVNLQPSVIDDLISSREYLMYRFIEKEEKFYVNSNEVKILNNFNCPSIFALQYHYLSDALTAYKNERVLKVSCEHLKLCWHDSKRIYFINSPETQIQLSLAEFLKSRLKGVNIVREYMCGAKKPVDVRVNWREANRSALIEVKLMGRAVKRDGVNLNTYEYGLKRAEEGMEQIKEYIDLANSDTPLEILKGYLVVLDGRRNKVYPKVEKVSRLDGLHFLSADLELDSKYNYHKTYPNIEPPLRMFAEPFCD